MKALSYWNSASSSAETWVRMSASVAGLTFSSSCSRHSRQGVARHSRQGTAGTLHSSAHSTAKRRAAQGASVRQRFCSVSNQAPSSKPLGTTHGFRQHSEVWAAELSGFGFRGGALNLNPFAAVQRSTAWQAWCCPSMRTDPQARYPPAGWPGPRSSQRRPKPAGSQIIMQAHTLTGQSSFCDKEGRNDPPAGWPGLQSSPAW